MPTQNDLDLTLIASALVHAQTTAHGPTPNTWPYPRVPVYVGLTDSGRVVAHTTVRPGWWPVDLWIDGLAWTWDYPAASWPHGAHALHAWALAHDDRIRSVVSPGDVLSAQPHDMATLTAGTAPLTDRALEHEHSDASTGELASRAHQLAGPSLGAHERANALHAARPQMSGTPDSMIETLRELDRSIAGHAAIDATHALASVATLSVLAAATDNRTLCARALAAAELMCDR